MLKFLKFKTIFLCQNALQIVTSVAIYFYREKEFIFIPIVLYAFMCVGANNAIFPVLSKKIFGNALGPQVFPFIYLFFSFASLFQWTMLAIFKRFSTLF